MLIYLYGVVPSDTADPPSELPGIEGAAVRLLRAGEIAGVVSPVPAAAYGEAVLDARVADLEWVGPRAVSHEDVLTWFVDRGPVIPLRPFSLHRSLAAVRERLEAGRDGFVRTLSRLAGRREWGIKVWRRERELTNHLEELSAPVRALTAEIRAASPGKRYLLTRKLAGLQAEELRIASAAAAAEIFAALQPAAEASRRLALPPTGGGERALILHSAYLVADERFADFQDAVNRVGGRFSPVGFELEFTGPWPPYHFADE
jgi:hypothetical protein